MSLLSPISKSLTSVAPKLVTLLLICLPAAAFAQSPAPQNPAPSSTAPTQANLGTPLTPLPQAPAPQHNAHPYSDQDYSRGKRQWPNPFVVYTAREVAPLNVTNSASLDQLLKDGKMYLSINDAVAMALENNLDIGIQRYNLSIADTDILRTSSGSPRSASMPAWCKAPPAAQPARPSAGGTGTSTTGSTGGGAGGTTIGVGGAGAGAAGIVSSTQGEGPPLDNYDPVITGTMSISRAITPESNTVIHRHQRIEQQHHHGQLPLHPGIFHRNPDDCGLRQLLASPPMHYSTR